MGEPPKPRVRRPSNFRQQDITRTIKAALSSGLTITRIDVEPNVPKFSFVMGGNTVTEISNNPFDVAPLPDEPPRRRRRK
jgi:hypothetical protein